MPEDVLRERRVLVDVDVVLADADAGDAALQGCADYLHAVRVGVASDIHGKALCVGAVAAPALGDIPLPRAVCAVQDERNTSRFADGVQQAEEGPVHVVNRAGRDAGLEL